jgi:hypothetical protein
MRAAKKQKKKGGGEREAKSEAEGGRGPFFFGLYCYYS